jgi:Tol biopolymer transport system component
LTPEKGFSANLSSPVENSPLRATIATACSRDGSRILFVSDSQGVWSLDRATGAEREVWRTVGADSIELIGITHDGAPLVQKEWIAHLAIVSGL